MKRTGILSVVFSLFLVTSANATHILELSHPDDTTNFHKIELLSSNVFDGSFYVWTYKVTSAGGGDTKALSHWLIDICTDYFDHATDTGGTAISIKTPGSPDPTLGIPGLKFDDEYSDDEMREVKIYMTKALEITQAQVGIKSGQNLLYGEIDAPSCECKDDEVPEPATIALVGAGIVGLTARRKRLI